MRGNPQETLGQRQHRGADPWTSGVFHHLLVKQAVTGSLEPRVDLLSHPPEKGAVVSEP